MSKTTTAGLQEIRAAYFDRVDKKTEPMLLALMLAERAPEAEKGRPLFVARDAATLLHIGHALHSLSVKQCNYGLTDRDESRREGLAHKATVVAHNYNLTATAHGDPRGFVLRLHGKGVTRNGFGDGFGVA